MNHNPTAPSVALVGCGRWGRYILRDLKQLGCRVSVVARSEATIASAQRGHADAIYANTKELLSKEKVAGAVVASPASTHFTIIQEIAVGSPTAYIFVEKPVVISSIDGWYLHKQFPNRIFVMDKWRYHRGILLLAEMARQRTLGAVHGIRAERLGWGNPHRDSNPVWGLLPHDLAIIQEILEEIPPLQSAQVQRSGGEVMGAAAALGTAPWVHCTVSAHFPERRRQVQLICEDGIAVLDDGYAHAVKVARAALHDGDTSPAVEEIPIDSRLPLFDELETFIRFLQGEAVTLKTPLLEALPAVEMIEKILSC